MLLNHLPANFQDILFEHKVAEPFLGNDFKNQVSCTVLYDRDSFAKLIVLSGQKFTQAVGEDTMILGPFICN